MQINNKLQFIPFYGHVSRLLDELDTEYKNGQMPISTDTSTRSSTSSASASRPTACFVYDWRRNQQEIADDFHDFCCTTFPDQPVQVLAHSMGGLIGLSAMRKYPDKYRPGAVMAGVPFDTGIAYLQDLHLGYFTELGRCRQFLPEAQFTLSSHWCFFPMSPETLEDAFVDVTDSPDLNFQANVSSIGKKVDGFREEPVKGKRIEIDFFNVDDWEKNKLGVFGLGLDEKRLEAYRNHMRIQIQLAREFREKALRPEEPNEDIPPLVVCATNTKPTINQILRRKNGDDGFDYDYSSGRSVPGDGRINFSGAFPPARHKALALQSFHAKQFLWEKEGGDLGKLMGEVDSQIAAYLS